MNNIQISRVTVADVAELQKIAIRTFSEAFAGGNTQQNLQQYIDINFALPKLTDELSDPDSEFYFAKVDDSVAGYLKVNSSAAQTELQDPSSLEIERIYVAKEWYGKHVGQALFEKAIEVAKNKDADFIWLGVWEENPRAINFYAKNGFVEFDKHQFVLGTDVQTDIMMRKRMK